MRYVFHIYRYIPYQNAHEAMARHGTGTANTRARVPVGTGVKQTIRNLYGLERTTERENNCSKVL